MRCRDVQQAVIVARYGGGELGPDATAHLAGCASCAAFAADSAALDQVLAAEGTLPVRPGFDTRFRARLEEQKGKGKVRSWSWTRLALGAAGTTAVAAVALVAVIGRDAPPRVETPPAPDLALAMNLELVENLDVVARLDEVEMMQLLDQVGPEALARAIRDTRGRQ